MDLTPSASPDISRLLTLFASQVRQHGFDAPNAANLSDWTHQPGPSVLFFTGDPRKVPETWDVAVVLPDVLSPYRPHLRVGLLDPSLSQTLASQYEVTVLPTLVFLRDGRALGLIERMRDWDEYAARIPAILTH